MRARKGWLAGFLVAAVAHVAALYWPRVEVTNAPVDSDKVVHGLLFAVPVFVGVVALRSWWPAAVLAVHAPVSEYLQATLLPGRSGTVADTIGDLAGVALGSLAAAGMLRRQARHPGPAPRS